MKKSIHVQMLMYRKTRFPIHEILLRLFSFSTCHRLFLLATSKNKRIYLHNLIKDKII
jgi:hypothetical protein